jgi:hypothetical protein
VDVHDQDGLTVVAGLRKRIEIRKFEARIATEKPKIWTREMVGTSNLLS